MSNDELYNKLSTLSKEDLETYRDSAISIKNFIDVVGVSTIFGMLMFTNIFTILFGGIVVYFMSILSINITNTLNYIRGLLSKLPAEDK